MELDKQGKTQAPASGRTLRSLLIICLSIAIVVLAFFYFKSHKPTAKNRPQQEKTWQVNTIDIQPDQSGPQLRLFGHVKAIENAELRAALSADVVEIAARDGQNVAKGALLVKLNEVDAQLKLAQASANVAVMEAQISAELLANQENKKSLKNEQDLVRLAQAALTRERRLSASNVSTKARLDQSQQDLQRQTLALRARELTVKNHENRLKQLQAELARANSLKSQAEIDLERTRITAPFSGSVASLSVSLGERVQIGQTVLRLISSRNLEVLTQLPNRWLASAARALQNGQTVTGKIRKPGMAAIPMNLTRLSGEANQGTGGVNAYFSPASDVNHAFEYLRHGESVDMLVNLPPLGSRTFSVPLSSLYGADRVYEVVDGRLKGHKVERLGSRFAKNGQENLMLAGGSLTNGMTIITTQLPNAIEGLKVRLKGQSTEASSKESDHNKGDEQNARLRNKPPATDRDDG